MTSTTTPEHLTLLFKCGKSVTVLSVLPDQPLADIKVILLRALESRNITNFPGTSTPLPSNAKDLELGILVDKRDASKGWISLDAKEQDVSEIKPGKRKSAGKKSGPIETPQDAGITDGYWLAYRLKSSRDDLSESEVPDIDMDEGLDWNVILPSYDDEQDELET